MNHVSYCYCQPKMVAFTMDILFLYVTAPDHATAIRLGRGAVEAQLAACANVFAPITSVYRWESQVVEEQETAFILKTRRSLAVALRVWLEEHHPYEIPCILEMPVSGGNPAYLQWVINETKSTENDG